MADVDTLTTPDLLSSADIAPVTVQAIPLELQAAEKLHAYTRTYEGARASSRVKDLVDLALIAELFALDAAASRDAIASTFARRATHEPPQAVPSPPEDWRVPFRRLAEAVGIASSLEAGHALAAGLLDPVLDARIAHGRWNPDAQSWGG